MRRWMVTWCADIPVNQYGESDFDEADNRYAWCDTRDQAEATAKREAQTAVWGYAEMQEWETCSVREAMAEEDRENFKDKRGQWWVEVGEKQEIHA